MAVLALVLVLVLPSAAAAQTEETLNGYAEWRAEARLIVDGQVVVSTPTTRFKGRGITSLSAIPLGYEVVVKGVRLADGRVEARELEAKPNGSAMFEGEVIQATNQMEEIWLSAGQMFEPSANGGRNDIGRIVETGPLVDRARSILRRLVPPYLNASSLRVRVIDTNEWNAAAMENGAIWINSGLLESMGDDEVAIVLGHELAHYTHEHARRTARREMWSQMIAAGTEAALAKVDNRLAREVAALAALFSVSAWVNGYSRDLEDQADRVGLRYAQEGGFNVGRGPALWARFREKYGESDRISTFLLGSHSRPSDRIRNLQLELARNYRGADASTSDAGRPAIASSALQGPRAQIALASDAVDFYPVLGLAYQRITRDDIARDALRLFAADDTTVERGVSFTKLVVRDSAGGERIGWAPSSSLRAIDVAGQATATASTSSALAPRRDVEFYPRLDGTYQMLSVSEILEQKLIFHEVDRVTDRGRLLIKVVIQAADGSERRGWVDAAAF